MTGSLRTSIFCLAILFGSLLSAQSAEEHVRGLFSPGVPVKWVRSLEGSVNSVHPVRLTLGFDGSAYRGIIIYDEFEDHFEVHGSTKAGVLTMEELDTDGNVSGFIRGTLERDRFSGNWWSKDMTRSADISLMEEGLVLLERFEPRFISLQGIAGNEPIDCFLSIESPQVISGTWQREMECVRLLGECGDFLCTDMELVVTEGELEGSTLSLWKKGKTYSVKVNGAGQPMNGTAAVESNYPLSVRSSASYSYLIDMAFPKIETGDFNKWLSGKFNSWYDKTIGEVSIDPEGGASNRWKFSASSWVDIYLSEDDLLSGVITYYDVTGNGYKREAFIYDLRNAIEIPLNEFDKRQGGLLKELRANITSSEVKSEEFKYVVLCESGFVVLTDFDSIQGDEEYCIPYASVGDVLKRRSILAKLAD